ncbi:phosphotransferase [Bacillus methanolicus]|uniref:phosphotransferase n=1 Tax=Bacillus methanolicus TaxID=1471 RepID=UPI00054EAA7A|nr:phosphotransferase [Bacillus methanolicus]
MKAVNMKGEAGGDDVFKNRLLAYLKKQIPSKIKEFRPIRKNVYYVKTNETEFILKGYSKLKRLKLQEAFTDSLKKEGFLNTYSFYSFTKEKTLFFEQNYYGCLQYIEPHPEAFSFRSHKNRSDGLNLLRDYHRVTSTLIKRYESLLPSFDLLEKWKERMALFSENLSVVKYFVADNILHEILDWANFSLYHLEKEYDYFYSSPHVILHGDVAHHNFIRTKKNKLYLIDFDLISKGPVSTDILQYANRILPFLNWSIKELMVYSEMKNYVKEKAFLYALMFPTDIFREWNRLVREKSLNNHTKVRQVYIMTVDQFYMRQHFMKQLEKMAK